MNQKEINDAALAAARKAGQVLSESGIVRVWEEAGCRVNLVGSLRMGLLAAHRDIDLHVYSRGISEQSSFAIAAKMARNPRVTEIRCINGLGTDERCVAWHFFYRHTDGELWQFDVIHIEEGSRYDGYFERMADRIVETMSSEQRDTILRLKFETADLGYHGVEYYEAIIADGVATAQELALWAEAHRQKEPYYWIP